MRNSFAEQTYVLVDHRNAVWASLGTGLGTNLPPTKLLTDHNGKLALETVIVRGKVG